MNSGRACESCDTASVNQLTHERRPENLRAPHAAPPLAKFDVLKAFALKTEPSCPVLAVEWNVQHPYQPGPRILVDTREPSGLLPRCLGSAPLSKRCGQHQAMVCSGCVHSTSMVGLRGIYMTRKLLDILLILAVASFCSLAGFAQAPAKQVATIHVRLRRRDSASRYL
jgi:hypothetical protein